MPKTQLTIQQLKDLIASSKVANINAHITSEGPVTKTKAHKYAAKRCTYDGINFASTKEATRYAELKLLEKAGEITGLKLQVPYELNEGGSHSMKYLADFVYTSISTGKEIVEDAKGFKTTSFKKKKKMMLKIHGIEIKET